MNGGTALVSRNQHYRFDLTRRWGMQDSVTFILLMPGPADQLNDDVSTKRCRALATSWGVGAFRLVSLFARRVDDWRDLEHVPDPVGYHDGVDNDEVIFDACRSGVLTVCGWGTKGELFGRAPNVLEIVRLARRVPYCLAQTDGHPWPPVYADSDCEPRRLEL